MEYNPDGLKALTSGNQNNYKPLELKIEWAAKISSEMDVKNNDSPSFLCFRDGVRKLAKYVAPSYSYHDDS
jgi:hypothetical protein